MRSEFRPQPAIRPPNLALGISFGMAFCRRFKTVCPVPGSIGLPRSFSSRTMSPRRIRAWILSSATISALRTARITRAAGSAAPDCFVLFAMDIPIMWPCSRYDGLEFRAGLGAVIIEDKRAQLAQFLCAT
jgi:hypothetical protein